MNDFFSVRGVNDDFTGQPIPVGSWPKEQIGLAQVSSYASQAPGIYSELQVFDGAGVRRLTSPTNLYVFNLTWICSKAQAEAFEGFYFNTIDEGLQWFKMPLSFAIGMQDCTVREVQGSPYQMARTGTYYQYSWQVEGYPGPLLPGTPPPTPIPPTDPVADTIDGGDSTSNFADAIDGTDSTTNLTDEISGGNAQF